MIMAGICPDPIPTMDNTPKPTKPTKPRKRKDPIDRTLTPPPNVGTRQAIAAAAKLAPKLASTKQQQKQQQQQESVTAMITKKIKLDHHHQNVVVAAGKEWTERDDHRLLFFSYFKREQSTRLLAKKFFRLEEDVQSRLDEWAFETNLQRERQDICEASPVARHSISAAHLWTRTVRDPQIFTTCDDAEFHELPQEEQAKWEEQFVRERARYVRTVQEMKHNLPMTQREELRRYNYVLGVREYPKRFIRRDQDTFEYFQREIVPHVEALYRKTKRGK